MATRSKCCAVLNVRIPLIVVPPRSAAAFHSSSRPAPLPPSQTALAVMPQIVGVTRLLRRYLLAVAASPALLERFELPNAACLRFPLRRYLLSLPRTTHQCCVTTPLNFLSRHYFHPNRETRKEDWRACLPCNLPLGRLAW